MKPHGRVSAVFLLLFNLFIVSTLAQDPNLEGYEFDPEPIIDSVPEQCRDPCNSISESLYDCMGVDCLCTSGNNEALQGCVSCLYGEQPGDQSLEAAQDTLRDFSAVCLEFELPMLEVTTTTTTSEPPPPTPTPTADTTTTTTTIPPTTSSPSPTSPTVDIPTSTTDPETSTSDLPSSSPTSASERPTTSLDPGASPTSPAGTPRVFQSPQKCQLALPRTEIEVEAMGQKQSILDIGAKGRIKLTKRSRIGQSPTVWAKFRRGFGDALEMISNGGLTP